jgi:hypothetical protein
MKQKLFRMLTLCVAMFAATGLGSASGAAAYLIQGRVEGGGGPIAKATVTLWAAGPNAPQKLAETQTKGDGRFALSSGGGKAAGGVFYLISKGGEPKADGGKGPNPAIVLMATLEHPAEACDDQ